MRLDGTTVANGQAFTGNTWTVTDGAIVTTSADQITIPAYPIGDQLSALAFNVDPGLAILPGDPVTIADPTGANTMTGFVTSYVAASGALVVQIGCTFKFEIRRGGPRNTGSGYSTWYDFGIPDEHGPLLSASLGDGISHVDVGIIQIMIPEAMFRRLSTGTYSAALTVSDSVNTRQMFIGQLPVQFGGVR